MADSTQVDIRKKGPIPFGGGGKGLMGNDKNSSNVISGNLICGLQNIQCESCKLFQEEVYDNFNNQNLSKALIKLDQNYSELKYFKENFDKGLLKKCPKCKSLIEKMQGCDQMVCGRDADGGNLQHG